MTRAPIHRRFLRGAAGAVLSALALVGAARETSADGPGSAAGFEYRIDVAPDLSRLDVRIRFVGFVPRRLGLAGGGTLGAVTAKGAGASLVPDPDDATALRVLSLDAEGACAYSVDLGAVARAGGATACARATTSSRGREPGSCAPCSFRSASP